MSIYTSIEKHEIHCAKRYLDYTETEHYRAFRDKYNPNCYGANYAVLKSCADTQATFAAVEAFFAWRDEAPVSFRAAPDAVYLVEAMRVFSQYGYVIKPYHTTQMQLTAQPDQDLHILPCATKCIDGVSMWPERPLMKEALGDAAEHEMRFADTRLQGGGKAFFAYNKAGVPVSVCTGEGYGSAFAITQVYTPAPCRRQGCATAAVSAALQHAKQNGYTDVFLSTDDKNAIALYRRLGFRGRQAERYWACKGEVPAWIAALP
ncbi:MAG: GNAT family N-acetyltransferase [Ruthenibacterium sp.]